MAKRKPSRTSSRAHYSIPCRSRVPNFKACQQQCLYGMSTHLFMRAHSQFDPLQHWARKFRVENTFAKLVLDGSCKNHEWHIRRLWNKLKTDGCKIGWPIRFKCIFHNIHLRGVTVINENVSAVKSSILVFRQHQCVTAQSAVGRMFSALCCDINFPLGVSLPQMSQHCGQLNRIPQTMPKLNQDVLALLRGSRQLPRRNVGRRASVGSPLDMQSSGSLRNGTVHDDFFH